MAENDIAALLSGAQTAQMTDADIRNDQELNTILDKSEIHEFIDKQKKVNTVNCTKRDMKIVYEYLVNKRGEVRNIENIPPNELDILLSRFYIEVRKRDGSEYEPGSINSMKSSVDRYLKDCEYGYTLRDKEFNLSNRTLSAKMVDLKKQGKGQKPNASRAVSVTEEEIMWDKGQLGDSCPRVLLFSIWYFFIKCFGLRGRQEHRQLKVGDLQLKKDTSSGREYVEFSERMTKTRDGTGKENARKNKPRIFATGNNRDPVKLYKMYLEKRPEESKEPDFPFYLTCIPADRISSNMWYYPRPMGENYLAQLMPMAAKDCGFEHKTNHSVRKTCVQTLRKAGVARDKIKHITGHKSTNSIESYDDKLSDEEQIEFSDILTRNPSTGANNSSSVQNLPFKCNNNVLNVPNTDKSLDVKCENDKIVSFPSTSGANLGSGSLSNVFGSGTVLQNCTFNINMNMTQSVSTGPQPKKKFRRIIYSDSESSQD